MPSTDINDYSAFLFRDGLDVTIKLVFDLQARLDTLGFPQHAGVLRRAFLDYQRELGAIAVRVAAYAETQIKAHQADSRVRPDTQGRGGPSMTDEIGVSGALPVPGAVGINDERHLETKGVGWWWTNEEGYTGFVGRVLEGVFMPGSHSPSPKQRREHPLFQGRMLEDGEAPSGKTPFGVISEPIPARRFVLKGFKDADARWNAEMDRADAKMVAAIDRAILILSRRP